MKSATYDTRRDQLETYFDRTAARTWEQLTSDAPVSKVRQTVRAGRDHMRAHMLSWLPHNLDGKRVLDAGCGTGALSVELAKRGAQVTAVDISGSLLEVAKKRTPEHLLKYIDYRVGDMLATHDQPFDHVMAMDSLIHYPASDMRDAINALSQSISGSGASLVFTFAPRTHLLMAMKHIGRLFPQGDRSPAIEPIAESHLRTLLIDSPINDHMQLGRTHRVDTRFYKSQALELAVP